MVTCASSAVPNTCSCWPVLDRSLRQRDVAVSCTALLVRSSTASRRCLKLFRKFSSNFFWEGYKASFYPSRFIEGLDSLER